MFMGAKVYKYGALSLERSTYLEKSKRSANRRLTGPWLRKLRKRLEVYVYGAFPLISRAHLSREGSRKTSILTKCYGKV